MFSQAVSQKSQKNTLKIYGAGGDRICYIEQNKNHFCFSGFCFLFSKLLIFRPGKEEHWYSNS